MVWFVSLPLVWVPRYLLVYTGPTIFWSAEMVSFQMGSISSGYPTTQSIPFNRFFVSL